MSNDLREAPRMSRRAVAGWVLLVLVAVAAACFVVHGMASALAVTGGCGGG
jgi:hypothetical protein